MTDEIWTDKRVLIYMVEATKILYDETGKVGPAAYGQAWPEYQLNQADKATQILSETNTVGRLRARVPRTAREISMMEHVFCGPKGHDPWLWRFLEDKPGMRHCVELHVDGQSRAELCNVAFNAKRMCQRIGLNYRTYRSRRSDGARIIAHHLNELGVSF
jgi:hypothetical protein